MLLGGDGEDEGWVGGFVLDEMGLVLGIYVSSIRMQFLDI